MSNSIEPLSVKLEKSGVVQFKATNAQGKMVLIDGPPSIGGSAEGATPMEMVLMALGGCSAMDVLTILQKQKQPVEDLRIEVEGVRAPSYPRVFTHITVTFVARGQVSAEKLSQAIALSAEKYCSVSAMLSRGGTQIQWNSRLE